MSSFTAPLQSLDFVVLFPTHIPLATGVGTCVFLPAKIFFVGFHEFESEIGVFDGAEYDADIFSSSFCHFARFLDSGFFVPFYPQMYPRGYICG